MLAPLVESGAVWTDFTGTEDGWKVSPWFGGFHSVGTDAGWVYHPAHGWVWAQGPAENDFWMWEEVPGWTWTANTVYPHSYDPDYPGWMYFEGETGIRFRLTGATKQRDHPVAVFTEPAHGEHGVPVDLSFVEVTFDRPMASTAAWNVPREWGGSFAVWSADRRSVAIHRFDARNPLPPLSVIRLRLNPAGNGFADPQGTPALPHTFAFTTGPVETLGPRIVRTDPPGGAVDVDPWLDTVEIEFSEPMARHGGFVSSNWWPWSISWSDDPWMHEESAFALLKRRSAFAAEIGCPLLVPVFPRPFSPAAPEPGGIYVHALDRYSLDYQWQGLERIDLQMVAMIDDALARLLDAGHSMAPRIFMMGFSASASFTCRFAILHPERVKAAAAGAGGGWPTAPVATWEGTPLRYPIGVFDYESLTGRTFPLEAFRNVALYLYVGSQDTNDGLDVRGIPETEKAQIHAFLNWPSDPFIANRWPLAESMHKAAGANAKVVIYPGVDHRISQEMYEDLAVFFRQNR